MTSSQVSGEQRHKLILAINSPWNVVNFRAGLIRELIANNYDVVIATPRDDRFTASIEALGCRFIELPMQPRGRSPLGDLALLGRYIRLLRRERPAALLSYTPKPNIYGSLAARICRVPAIANIAGLGIIFNERGLTNWLVKKLYGVALRWTAHVFFQNRDDQSFFESAGLVPAARTELLPGSGVDLARFVPQPAPGREETFKVLLIARLLWEKGIGELVEAGRIMRAAGQPVEIRLLGFLDPDSSAYVPHDTIVQWAQEGAVTYLGSVGDVRPHLAQADCFVLPTYYPEGTPRALLEAAAMAKPLITCDRAGCRDVVEEGNNGFLVPMRDPHGLADRLLQLARKPAGALAQMGQRSRQIVTERFDERLVIDRYLAALTRVMKPSHAS